MDRSPHDVATAYHEAGHAVVALVLDRPVQRVSILPNHLRLGHCELGKGKSRASQDVLEREILILLGGAAAEARYTGEYDWDAADRDLRNVRSLTEMRAVTQRQIERLERRMLDKVEHLLDRPGVWQAVQRIAEELLASTTISGRAVRHLFERTTAEADR